MSDLNMIYAPSPALELKFETLGRVGREQFKPAHSLLRLCGPFDSFPGPENAVCSQPSAQESGNLWSWISKEFAHSILTLGILAFVLSMLLVAKNE
ncbi:hypothetical protein CEXT_609891 [Caerostris extrusa]|uniref:Uncharacterized protein n=1 Tax=Caerostris extrusa TaxID=172846 RepID=A0AAV4NT60_CAEEX|nr:hypothetical protein CEXT_609891 [Caerostris extrusa]